jgi:oligopeptide/dipeptide ABC transporter ATP-binding protein
MPLLEVADLRVAVDRRDGPALEPVRGVSLTVEPGETLAVVGESGCGKSITCLAVAGLLPRRCHVAGGAVRFEGATLTAMGPRAARAIRRRGMASVFQDATNGLNPVLPIGRQIAEAARLRAGMTRAEARREAIRLLGRVGLPDPERRAREYPHQFSGGMNQRAMIALAVAGGPKLLIADEATTALDVTIQAQILALIADLRREYGMGVVLVTHDLGVVAESADRVAVMYAGRIVETATVDALFAAPRHPYTLGLLRALPRADRDDAPLLGVEGVVPPLDALPPGCAFAPRCPRAALACAAGEPAATPAGPGRAVACLRPEPERRAA